MSTTSVAKDRWLEFFCGKNPSVIVVTDEHMKKMHDAHGYADEVFFDEMRVVTKKEFVAMFGPAQIKRERIAAQKDVLEIVRDVLGEMSRRLDGDS